MHARKLLELIGLQSCGYASRGRQVCHCHQQISKQALQRCSPRPAVLAVGDDVDVGVAVGDRVLFSKYSSSGACRGAIWAVFCPGSGPG